MKKTTPTTKKSLYTELILCIFLGGLGIHRFYTKKIGTGILYLLTYGLFGIGWLVDIVLIIVRIVNFGKDADTACMPYEPPQHEVTPVPLIVDAPESVHVGTSESFSDDSSLSQAVDLELVNDLISNTVTTPDPVPAVKPESKQKTYKVTGMQHRMDNIMRLATENPDYEMTKKELIESGLTDQRIWQYEFFPSKVELVPEPTNPVDKNAIMVVVDGEHVGYIKSGTCAHLLKVIREDRILDISCEMGGGAYKYVAEDYDEDKDKEVYTLDRDTRPYFVHLNISEAAPQ